MCLYEHSCPYLDGLSTTWVLGEYRRADDTYHEHLRIIDAFDGELETARKRIRELERENAELRAKYQALRGKQFKANKKKADEVDLREGNNAPIPEVSGKKKRGAPIGHPGWSRPVPAHIDRTVHVSAPTICPHCSSGKLSPMAETVEHIQEDMVLVPRPVATRYVHDQALCAGCGQTVIQAAADELLHAPIGPVAKATAGYLRYEIGISYRKVQRMLKDLFGLSCVPASLVGFDQQAAKKGEPLYEEIREKIRASSVVHADETSWRNDGVGHFAWFAGNDRLAFFQIDRHRSADVALAIFGEDFGGTLVRDRYAAYNGIGTAWQSCLAHLITRAKEISREHAFLPEAEKDHRVGPFCAKVAERLGDACKKGEKLRTGDLPWSATAAMEKKSVKDLNNICKRPLRFKPAETLRAYLTGPEQQYLFTFLRVPGVPPTNNHAEQSLRHMVIFRKVCFGTRSDKGLVTHSVLPSLVQTARRQGVHPREFLQILLTADTATAQAALYNNSS